jgi:hypothetical protein
MIEEQTPPERSAISFAIRANAAQTHADILKVWQDQETSWPRSA